MPHHESTDRRRAVKRWSKSPQLAFYPRRPDPPQRSPHAARQCPHQSSDWENVVRTRPDHCPRALLAYPMQAAVLARTIASPLAKHLGKTDFFDWLGFGGLYPDRWIKTTRTVIQHRVGLG